MDLVKIGGYRMPNMPKIWAHADENYGHGH
jgi:hypothetical protein